MDDAERWAEEQITKVEATLGPLAPGARRALFEQHLAFYPQHRQREMMVMATGAAILVFFLMRR